MHRCKGNRYLVGNTQISSFIIITLSRKICFILVPVIHADPKICEELTKFEDDVARCSMVIIHTTTVESPLNISASRFTMYYRHDIILLLAFNFII